MIPILEWTLVSVAIVGFCGFTFDSEMGLLDFPAFGVLLVMVTRMDVLMCFRADILLEIPRVHVSR